MSEPLTKADLNSLIYALENNRDRALEKQTEDIKELFDAKLSHIAASVLTLSTALSKHADADQAEFDKVYARIEPLQLGMALTKLKVAGIIAAASTVSGAVAAFVVKHFMNVVVYK